MLSCIMSPTTIDQCPTEVLQEIFLNLVETNKDTEKPSFPNHPNLFLVNRRFREVAKLQYYSSLTIGSIKQSEHFADLIRVDASMAQCVVDLHLNIEYIKPADKNERFLATLEFILTKCKNINQFEIFAYIKIFAYINEGNLQDDIFIKCIELLDKSILKSLKIISGTYSRRAFQRISSFSWPVLTHLSARLDIETAQILSRCPSLREFECQIYNNDPFDGYVLQALIDHCSYLHTFIFGGKISSEGDMVNFIEKKGPQLEKLKLHNPNNTFLGNKILETICYHAQSIKDIYLTRCDNMNDLDGVIRLLNTCGNLKSLILFNCERLIGGLHTNLSKICGAELLKASRLVYESLFCLEYDALLRITKLVEGELKHREVKLQIALNVLNTCRSIQQETWDFDDECWVECNF